MSIRFEAQTPLKHSGIGQACEGEVEYRKILYQMSLQATGHPGQYVLMKKLSVSDTASHL